MAPFIQDAPALPLRELEAKLKTNFAAGLTQEEAERRKEVYGENKLPEEPPKPILEMIIEQFEDTLVRILLAAALISFVLAWFEEDESEKLTAFIEPLVILCILIANAFVGVWQEMSAGEALKALLKLSAPSAVVQRDGETRKIDAAQLVPGDVVIISNGDQVPADIRVTEVCSTTIRVDQSTLTGECHAIMKHEEPVETTSEKQFYLNMLYSSTCVTYGKAKGVVVSTGLGTEFGAIYLGTKETTSDRTQLEKKLDEFGALLTKWIGVICLLVWIVNIRNFTTKGSWFKGCVFYLKQGVALAVAAIPEGLPAVVTTCLALGTRRMAQKHALVRKLPSVETLGCTTVICSDKTGTLTTNKMVVRKVCTIASGGNVLTHHVHGSNFNPVDSRKWVPGQIVDPAALFMPANGSPTKCPLESDAALRDVAVVASLCNEASLQYNNDEQQVERINDAMEAALKVFVEKIGLDTPGKNQALMMAPYTEPSTRLLACNNHWSSEYKKNGTLEFTRDRKTMSVHVSACTGGHLLAVKGAPDVLIERCVAVKQSNGQVVPLTPQVKDAILRRYHDLAAGAEALRCLGMAVKQVGPYERLEGRTEPARFAEIESGLTFVGFVGILDPPRKEVRTAIEQCNTAHIRVIVITGDNKDTAEAICREIGLFAPDEDTKGKSFTGQEFSKMTRAQQEEAVVTAKLFSRAVPEHKKTITEALQARGFVCAMTGDGVNDALALKKADIGIAMGSGTEVAKKASDMVLEDDNFSTIVAAVEEGRTIYSNTKQFIRYLISSNIGEVVCIFLTGMLGMPEVLVPIQLLWVNLVTDGFPATALGFNPPEPDVMKTPPRRSGEPIVNGTLFLRYVIIGGYVGLVTVAGFGLWCMYSPSGPQVSFSTLCAGDGHEWLENPSWEYGKKVPMTVALSVLVTVEMFNALNALSENMSLITVGPLANVWLLLAICLSFSLHFLILYVPIVADIFGAAPLDWWSWKLVLALSIPVVFLDEAIKLVSRLKSQGETEKDKTV